MGKCFLSLMATLILCAPIAAQASDALKLTLQTGVASQHLFTDGIVLHDRPVEQTAILAKLPLGLMAGVWHVTGLDDLSLHSNGGDEFVFGGGWSAHTEQFVFEAGVKHHANAGVRGQTTIPEIEFGYVAYRDAAHKIEPYVNAELPISHGHVVTELSAGTEHVWRFTPGISLRHRASGQFNSAAHGRDATLLIVYRAGLAWNVLKRDHFSISILGPTVRIYAPLIESRGYSLQQAYGATVDMSWN
jgi:hypothetical protein